MYSSKVAIALVASLALASAAPELLGGLSLGETIGEGQGGLGGVIGQQGGLWGILEGGEGNNGGIGKAIPQGGLGDVTGGESDLLSGLLSGILRGGEGGVGEILGGILSAPGGLGNLFDLLGNPQFTSILEPLLGDILKLIKDLLQNIQKVLASLESTLQSIITAITSNGSLDQQVQALTKLREQDPVPFDTIFFIVSQLEKTGENGGVVPTLPVTVPTPATPTTPQL